MKKNYIFLTVVLFLLFINSPVHGQSDSLLNLVNDLSESETELTGMLADLEENPLNINEAGREELLTLPWLSGAMADSILAHRERQEPYSSKRQIRPVVGPEIYDLIKSFIHTSQRKKLKLNITQRHIYRIENIPQIKSGEFRGNALNTYTKIKYKVNRQTRLGLMAQKDAGEENYLDHYNYYLQHQNRNWNILLGDYYLQLAEGLSHSNPYGHSKSINLSPFREETLFARANLTSAESSGKFGLFVQYDFLSRVKVFIFYSNANRDAQLTDNFISGFKFDGLHRSHREWYARDKFREQNRGIGWHYQLNESFNLLAFYNHYSFNKKIEQSSSVIGESQKRRQYFNFSGSELSQASVAYSGQVYRFKMSGELSASDKGRPGWSQSLYYSQNELNMGFKYWYLNKDFQTIDGRAFDNSNPFPRGVQGFFYGLTIKPDKQNSFSAFKKYEQDLWRTYFNPLPASKNEWLVQWDLKREALQLSSRFRSRNTENYSGGNLGTQTRENTQHAVRLQVRYSPSKNMNSLTRWEYIELQNKPDRGTLIFQDINYHFSPELSANTRFSFFNTTSFDARIYEYERDLPGNFSNVALFGNGNKMNILLIWKFKQNYSVWIKWRYISKDQIYPNGTRYKALNRDIRLQILVRF